MRGVIMLYSTVTSADTNSSSTSTSTDTYLTYLQRLFTYDTERLYRETEHLHNEKAQFENGMLTLTFDQQIGS
ncbi:unnamed protein product [Didymodactylos carnosus]|uniref:Uncharacterized protein n=1 Tax=Didymodactylos carnosus TaxID=1234261 RepID=A0A814C1W3_9BILA|nr:unnamed protein product [Didymodactylos carnosus]CAF0935687.1 unnamed protein product [Didymodactylos carnosus]CAF3650477.1 unnamed protein product [Didymodactylos carnosus]CAF3712975.1 unnamed protein product [Didymodactylos carnosus]